MKSEEGGDINNFWTVDHSCLLLGFVCFTVKLKNKIAKIPKK